MSRHPFREFSSQYMDRMRGVYSDHYWKVLDRRFRRIDEDLRMELSRGMISTTSPKKLTPEDLRTHLLYRSSLGHCPTELTHEIAAFSVLLDFVDNNALRTCLKMYPGLRPPSGRVRLSSLGSGDMAVIRDAVLEVSGSDDFVRVRSWALLSLILGCGLRTKEARLMDRSCLDTDGWTVEVMHPKGEDSYASARTVPIHPHMVPAIARYVEMRDRMFPDKVALFCPTRNSDNDYMSGNRLRTILGVALDECGIDADPRKLRRSFGQFLLDSGVDSIETVSVLMGHATTKTTEKYYARRRNDMAVESVRRLWRENDEKYPDEDVGAGGRRHNFLIQSSKTFVPLFENSDDSHTGRFTHYSQSIIDLIPVTATG